MADVCLAAARKIWEKKAVKKAGETPGAASVSAPPDDVARVPAVFDRPAAKAASKREGTSSMRKSMTPHNHSVSCVFKSPALNTPHGTSRQQIFLCAITTGTYAINASTHNSAIPVAAISHSFIQSPPFPSPVAPTPNDIDMAIPPSPTDAHWSTFCTSDDTTHMEPSS